MSTSSSAGNAPAGVVRIFYQEIKEGDRRKIEGKSNLDPHAGGGARDLRFPDKAFRDLFETMFPKQRSATRSFEDESGRKVTEDLILRVGDVRWRDDDDKLRTTEIEYWPPTHARPREGRIGRINALGALESLPPESEGQLFVLVTQHDDGSVHVRHASMKGIQAGNKSIADHIRWCADTTPEHRSIRGYIDFTTGKVYCHA